MTSPTDDDRTDARTRDAQGAVRSFAARCGSVFASFEEQDSGCVSYGVESGMRRWFLKGPTSRASAQTISAAAEFHRRVRHAAIVRPVEVTEVEGLPVLRFPWVEGETLYQPTTRESGRHLRERPDSAHRRFRRLPVDEIVLAVDAVYSAHVEIARAGYVAIDLYDGCLHYDFARRRMRLIDLDEYRRAPVVVREHGALPGSTRFRAPEQATPGSVLDERSTVFSLGQVARVLLDEGDGEGGWRGPVELAEVARRASAPDPAARYATVAELAGVWRAVASIAD